MGMEDLVECPYYQQATKMRMPMASANTGNICPGAPSGEADPLNIVRPRSIGDGELQTHPPGGKFGGRTRRVSSIEATHSAMTVSFDTAS
jgi:hypothetical protein